MIRLALASSAALAVVPLQDVLGLGSSGADEYPRAWRRAMALADDGAIPRRCWLATARGADPSGGPFLRARRFIKDYCIEVNVLVNKPLVILVRSKMCDRIREDFHDRCLIEP